MLTKKLQVNCISRNVQYYVKGSVPRREILMGEEKEEGNIYGREDLVISLGGNLGTPAKKVSHAGTGGRGDVRKF